MRIAFLIAVVEGVLVVVGAISGWAALAVAAVVVGFHFVVGRKLPSDAGRQASWTAALSQVLVALVPVLVFVVGAVAIVAIGILAVLGVAALLAERR